VKTVSLSLGNGRVPVEIWYPAQLGSQKGKTKVYYNFADWLPPESGVPKNASTPGIECNCYRDLPIDADHGPFPISIVVHDTGSFRVASSAQAAHWASRGFIAVAADHPGLTLRDTVASNGGCTYTGVDEDNAHTRDIPAIVRALRDANDDFAFLEAARDGDKIAISGHGRAGGAHVAQSSDQAGVQLVMSWDSNISAPKRDGLKAAIFLSGMSDKLVTYETVGTAFDTTAKDLHPALLIGLSRVGHLGVTQLCGARDASGKDLAALLTQYNACGGAAARILGEQLWDCQSAAGEDQYLEQNESTQLVNIATTIALEQYLRGVDRDSQWAAFKTRANVGEVKKVD
jgi:hypothetical protein